jgi:hypothetical protein
MTAYRTIYNDGWKKFCASWFQDFVGIHPDRDFRKDLWIPTVTGTFELFIYPVAIASGDWQALGGWIAIKTAVGWKRWSDDRGIYTRFVMGNGLIIWLSFLLTHWLKA